MRFKSMSSSGGMRGGSALAIEKMNRLKEFKLYKNDTPAQDYFDHLQHLYTTNQPALSTSFQPPAAQRASVMTSALLDSMVLMKPQNAFKFERNRHADTLWKRGIHRLSDIKRTRVVPDRCTKQSDEISLMNLTVKEMSFNHNRPRRQNESMSLSQLENRPISSVRQRKQERSRPNISPPEEDQFNSFCNIDVTQSIKKLEENQTNIIHELYDAHFTRKKATTAISKKRKSLILVEGAQDTIEANNENKDSLNKIVNLVTATKSRPVTTSKFVQYVPKQKKHTESQVEQAPNSLYFSLFSQDSVSNNLQKSLQNAPPKLNYHIASGQILAQSVTSENRCHSSHLMARQCAKLKEVDVAELQSQAFKYQQVLLTNNKKESGGHVTRASFFPASEVPTELVQIMQDKNDFRKLLDMHDRGLAETTSQQIASKMMYNRPKSNITHARVSSQEKQIYNVEQFVESKLNSSEKKKERYIEENDGTRSQLFSKIANNEVYYPNVSILQNSVAAETQNSQNPTYFFPPPHVLAQNARLSWDYSKNTAIQQMVALSPTAVQRSRGEYQVGHPGHRILSSQPFPVKQQRTEVPLLLSPSHNLTNSDDHITSGGSPHTLHHTMLLHHHYNGGLLSATHHQQAPSQKQQESANKDLLPYMGTSHAASPLIMSPIVGSQFNNPPIVYQQQPIITQAIQPITEQQTLEQQQPAKFYNFAEIVKLQDKKWCSPYLAQKSQHRQRRVNLTTQRIIAEPNYYYSNALLLVNGHAEIPLLPPQPIYNAEVMQFNSLSDQPDATPINAVGVSNVTVQPKPITIEKQRKKRTQSKLENATTDLHVETKQAKRFEREVNTRPKSSIRAVSAQRKVKRPRQVETPFEVHNGFTQEERGDIDQDLEDAVGPSMGNAGMSSGRAVKYDGLSYSSKQNVQNEDSASMDEDEATIAKQQKKTSIILENKGKKSILSKRSGAHLVHSLASQQRNSTLGGQSSKDKLSQRGGAQISSRLQHNTATAPNFHFSRGSIKNSPRANAARLRNADLHNLNTEDEQSVK
ncbi:hypothetical protein FGO68_gene6131 [Halteria grandinella]|uniref:Uncharacterized protein n=1 Tax=Halteria grandinella TaxID=5974 RepID=A0A8J8T837_HALGN|nr:hypothetical protein FGO68_gene6131 [Halteria grandinella]